MVGALREGPLSVDVYTPWREPPAELEARHVGRQAERDALRDAVRAWLDGRTPHPVYLFGPRGSGKSHLISLLLAEQRAQPPDVRVLHVTEDVPPAATAAELLRRMDRADRAGYAAFSVSSEVPRIGRAIVVLEALDVHLNHMSEDERRELRRHWQDQGFLLIATGCGLPDALTSSRTAFYHAFQAWPLHGLPVDEAAALLDHLAGVDVVENLAWSARRQALVVLAGGSPRSLHALGRACAADPRAWASDHLLTVVQQLTAHYQHQLRDLTPQQQRIVEVVTLAAYELTAPTIGRALDVSGASVATQCRRLRDHGVLLDRDLGSETLWRVAEPMFRYWFEYRSASWEESRVGVLARILEAVLQPLEIVDLLLSDGDETLREAARATTRSPAVGQALVDRFFEALRRTPAEALGVFENIPTGLQPLALLSAAHAGVLDAAARAQLAEPLGRLVPWLGPLLEVVDREPGSRYKEHFFRMVKALGEVPVGPRRWAADRVLAAVEGFEPRGAPWVLTPTERRRLASTPELRAAFLMRGRRQAHPPLLMAGDLYDLPRRDLSEDWSRLLSVCLRDPERRLAPLLLEAKVERVEFVPHPQTQPHPADRALLSVLLQRATGVWTPSLLTWAAVLSEADDAVWGAVMQGTAEGANHVRGPLSVPAVRALSVLRRVRPDRFDAWRADLAPVAPWSAAWFDRADEIARARLDANTRWQPELWAVVAALVRAEAGS